MNNERVATLGRLVFQAAGGLLVLTGIGWFFSGQHGRGALDAAVGVLIVSVGARAIQDLTLRLLR